MEFITHLHDRNKYKVSINSTHAYLKLNTTQFYVFIIVNIRQNEQNQDILVKKINIWLCTTVKNIYNYDTTLRAQQRCINVTSTSMQCHDIASTLLQRCVPTEGNRNIYTWEIETEKRIWKEKSNVLEINKKQIRYLFSIMVSKLLQRHNVLAM